MSTEPFIGEIKIFGFSFAPRGYQNCNGQLLGIAQNTALFSLLGTMYGGNGQTTFGLPDLQSRIPIGSGPSYIMGEMAGNTSASISMSNLPAHVHPATGISINVPIYDGGADTDSPVNSVLANAMPGSYSSGANGSGAPMVISGVTAASGSSLPIEIENPYLTLNYSIATEGIFPSRN